MLPLHWVLTFLVMILMTPPMASEPYRVDMGPRITSMRSMADIGGMKLVEVSLKPLGVTLPAGFWRRPSIRIRVYSLGIPRMLIFNPPRSEERSCRERV